MQAEKKNHKKTPPERHVVLRYLIEWGPFLFLLCYLAIILLIRLNLPDTKTIIRLITDFYAVYGYPTVFLSGLIEGTFLLGFYFPGSAAILLGAVVAKSGVVSLPLILLCGTAGLVVAYTINYFLGKHGWIRVVSQFGLDKTLQQTAEKLNKHGSKAIFLGYFSPSSGSLLSTASGMSNMPFRKFLLVSMLSQSFWSIVWGIIAYMLGSVFVEVILNYLVYIVWGVVIIIFGKEFLKEYKKRKAG